MNTNQINKLEDTATSHCPKCGRRLERVDVDGGRCVGCMSSLASVVITEQPKWEVETEQHGAFVMRAESEVSVQAACKRRGIKVTKIRQHDMNVASVEQNS